MKRSAAALDALGEGDERRGRAPEAKRQRHDDDRHQNPSLQRQQQQQPRPAAGSSGGVRLLSDAKEEDPHRLAQRQKQIDYGKNTVGYDRYCVAVPRYVLRASGV